MSEESGAEHEAVDSQLDRLPPHLRGQMTKVWSTEEWSRLGREERHRLALWIWRLIESDVRDAVDADTLGARGDAHTSRTVSKVDERGWRELNRIQDEALAAILAAKAESAERLAESGEAGRAVLSAMLSVEMAAREPGRS